MPSFTQNSVLALRLERLGLSRPARTEAEYEILFRRHQPVPTIYFCEPGSPPQLRDRAAFDDREYNYGLRRDRVIIKGRFQGGNIGYVCADELEGYAALYRKPLAFLSEIEQAVYRCVEQDGPIYKEQIAEETGIKGSAVSKALTRLQSAFLVHADHGDAYDEQLWFHFPSEFPHVDLSRRPRSALLEDAVLRFVEAMALTNPIQARDWLRLPLRELEAAFAGLAGRGVLLPADAGPETGWILASDADILSGNPSACPPSGVFVMHRADLLVRAFDSELRNRFAGLEILQYLLVDGRFAGAVAGHWRIGPHDVDDIVLTLPPRERLGRREEILSAVGRIYHPPYSHILRYDGLMI